MAVESDAEWLQHTSSAVPRGQRRLYADDRVAEIHVRSTTLDKLFANDSGQCANTMDDAEFVRSMN
ncbi:hypothetical protein BIW11_04028 [Tropilaelaps mercedesae]|uniref:Uncharacterized protein n=1 Tax=Tropilaelaps mercedesae TaxID=418985 RepID=A0A1V9XC69_9ACAR|nr:hypothetical protein BIW11_04028 [Tropilaelaps mercedesae]